MQLEQYSHSYLRSALVFSLAAHLLLLMPWQYGTTLSSGSYLQEKPRAQLRLSATLREAASSHHEPVAPSTTNLSAQALEEEVTAPPITPLTSDAAVPPSGVPLDLLYYYTVAELDQRPVMRQPPRVENAPGNGNLIATGSATLELLIERTGQVNVVNIIRADLPESYIRSLESAFGALRYAPGIKQQQKVRSRLYIEVEYQDGMLSNVPGVQYSTVPPAPMIDTKAVARERKIRRLGITSPEVLAE